MRHILSEFSLVIILCALSVMVPLVAFVVVGR